MIRVLIADNSPTTRALLAEIVRRDPELELVGVAEDGAAAVELTRARSPDVVVMDIRMPRMDGFEATRRIMATTPVPVVIVTATLTVPDVRVTMEALAAGALTAMATPAGPLSPTFAEEAARFVRTLKAMSRVKVVRRWADRAIAISKAGRPATARARPRDGARVVAIAASTGGPGALQQILAALPSAFPAPILVVQHISSDFNAGFAEWLAGATGMRVKLAEHGEPLEAATVYVAPAHRHLGSSAAHEVSLSSEPPIEGFRPAGTHLFASVARVFGRGVVGVILTGMGRDGAVGLSAVKQAGGYVVAQDEGTSVVFGMPQVAIAAGVTDVILPLPAIAQHLKELVDS